MRDITAKTETLRTATASATVHCSRGSMAVIGAGGLPKGDPFATARAAALLAAKQTSGLIPHCHPVGIDALDIGFASELADTEEGQRGMITVQAAVKSIGRTGVEMEALSAVRVAALVLYDQLKCVDDSLEITGIRLLAKTGGKSDRKYFNLPPACAVLVCSGSAAAGKREDRSGKVVKALL
jgi:molybdenum cofactor biosynthesis protein MoaC